MLPVLHPRLSAKITPLPAENACPDSQLAEIDDSGEQVRAFHTHNYHISPSPIFIPTDWDLSVRTSQGSQCGPEKLKSCHFDNAFGENLELSMPHIKVETAVNSNRISGILLPRPTQMPTMAWMGDTEQVEPGMPKCPDDPKCGGDACMHACIIEPLQAEHLEGGFSARHDPIPILSIPNPNALKVCSSTHSTVSASELIALKLENVSKVGKSPARFVSMACTEAPKTFFKGEFKRNFIKNKYREG